MVGLHRTIKISFLIVGHTKFSPDWCFDLLKQKFRKTVVNSLKDIEEVVDGSAVVNISQLVGNQSGEVIVPTYNWSEFFGVHGLNKNVVRSHVMVIVIVIVFSSFPASVSVSSLLLFIAGDVELNPGPYSGKFQCSQCGKAVQDGHEAILCDSCSRSTLISCCGIDIEEYHRLSKQEDEQWFYPGCRFDVCQSFDGDAVEDDAIFPISGPSSQRVYGLKCICLNARSVVNKINDIFALLECEQPDVLAVTESYLNSEIFDSEITPPSYLFSEEIEIDMAVESCYY